MEKKKYQLYRERTFSEKLNDTVGFLQANWRPVGLWCVYIILPLSLLGAVVSDSMMDSLLAVANGLENDSSFSSQLLSSGLQMVMTVVNMTLICTLFQLYLRRANGLEQLEWGELRPPLQRNLVRILLFGLVFTLLWIVILSAWVGLLVGFYLVTRIIVLPVLLFLASLFLLVPLPMCPMVYLFEDGTSIREAILKGYRLGWKTYGSLLGLLLVLGFITGFLGSMFEAPRLIVLFFNLFSADSTGNSVDDPSLLASMGNYLLSVIMVFGSQLAAIISYLGVVFHYGHAAETVDGVTVDERIEQFNTL